MRRPAFGIILAVVVLVTPLVGEAQPAQSLVRVGYVWSGRPGTDATMARDATGMYQALDPNHGQLLNLDIEDQSVDNLAHSQGGGLQAHNYWDNEVEVIPAMVDILKHVQTGAPRLVARAVTSPATR